MLRRTGAGKGSEEGQGRSGVQSPIPKAAVSGQGKEEPECLCWGPWGALGQGPEQKARWAATEGALAGHERNPWRVGPPLPRLPPTPPAICCPRVPPARESGNAGLGLVDSSGRSRSRGGNLHPESPTESPSNWIADPPAPGPPSPSPGPFRAQPGPAWKNSERDSQRRDDHRSAAS
ncbi:putative NAD(+)--arginine ADP-ribosyltransferase Mav [Cebus imitator]|uniref:putative NAD(+)--arginine ADP-ribosyltransferase Mav n=1 Tax=Cebus imitator TaxID=2715852 RepID=UPI000809F26E|nr:putative NAD(+)--arginine ADP-ribosyltransferase Mav [Cebus imitator]